MSEIEQHLSCLFWDWSTCSLVGSTLESRLYSKPSSQIIEYLKINQLRNILINFDTSSVVALSLQKIHLIGSVE